MFVCDDGSLPFLGAGYTTELRLPPGFPPYFRCGSYLNAGSRRPITVHILTSTQPVVKLMENFSRE